MRKMVRLLFYLICYDLCCSWLSELHTSTSEDRGQFISLCINGQGHMEGKRAEETAMTVSRFSPPLHSEMFLSMPWEQECKTSALVTKERFVAPGKDESVKTNLNKSSVSSKCCFSPFAVNEINSLLDTFWISTCDGAKF